MIRDAAKIDNIDRLRFTTSHPFEFKDDLVELYLDVPELVSHVHLPIQSGSDRILKLMRRRYTRESYLDLVNRIRTNRPDISFSSDFIVGFPGETEEDFKTLWMSSIALSSMNPLVSYTAQDLIHQQLKWKTMSI